MLLDRLILDGNSSRFPLVKEMAESPQMELQVKEVVIQEETLKRSVALGAALYGVSLKGLGGLRVRGVHKLNYPIGILGYLKFRPLFERWVSLEPGNTLLPDHDFPIDETAEAKRFFFLHEFFGWDYNIGVTEAESSSRKVAELEVPVDDEAFRGARYWTFQLKLWCDDEGRAHLLYNYAVGMEEDGSDFRPVWNEHRECSNFSYT
jgi:hypothetical protein